MTTEQIEKRAEEYYHRFVQYEWNPISDSMKQSIIDAIAKCYIEYQAEKDKEIAELKKIIANLRNLQSNP